MDYFDAIRPAKTLEVGCNYGRELKLLEGKTKIYGIDLDASQVERAKRNIPDGKFYVADAVELPFHDNYFPLVYTCGMMSHNKIENIPKILGELLRVSNKYILCIEYVGSQLGPDSFGNCKKYSWVHDYEKLWATRNVNICFNRKLVFGPDTFHVMLLRKPKVKNTLFNWINKVEINQGKEEIFKLKIWKFNFKVEKSG